MRNYDHKRHEESDSEAIQARIEWDDRHSRDATDSMKLVESSINDLILRQARNEDERRLFEEKMRQLSA